MKASSDVTLRCMAVLMVCFAANGASAQEVYGGVGLFGAQIGYAHALSPSWTVRGDYMTMGQRSKTTTESDTEYQAHLKMNRKALLADWFPWESSSFRLTGGATFNQVQFDLTAGGAGTSVDINNKKYPLGANDALKIQVKMPSTTPYLGLGWGHKAGRQGWGFHADLGFSVGQFKLTETRTGELREGGALKVSQAEVDLETAEIRKSVAKIKFLPQATLGLSYQF